MNRTENLKSLEKLLYVNLKKEIGNSTVVLLDVPNYYNPGDQLIWEGEVQLLKKLDKQIRYTASALFFNPSVVSDEDCILLHGGGNFGDLYPMNQNFREMIVEKFPKNKIIVLPETIHFSNEKLLKKCAKLFSKNSNVIICARDKKSFTLLEKHFLKSKHLLLPDMAFSIKSIIPETKNHRQEKVLFLSRTDGEIKKSVDKNSLGFIKELDISDWPSYQYGAVALLIRIFIRYINRALLQVLKFLGLHWNKEHDALGLIKYHTKERQIQSGMKMISEYRLVITSRLHGHILACLMGIPNIILDNSYGKNRNFFETWMVPNAFNSYYADSPEAVRKIIAEKFPTIKIAPHQ
ncbi:MAG: polysaccharide pyruvyl transferase family protein [Candidatus Woesebacteria bacterium]